MKRNPPPTLLIFGGVAALAAAYYFVSKKKKVAQAAPASVPMYTLRANAPGVAGGCVSVSGELVDLKYCAPQLSGYFSIGDTPCCSGCAQGRGCNG